MRVFRARGMLCPNPCVHWSMRQMAEETSMTRSIPPPEGHGEGDLSLLRKEVIEARNLIIKTDNLLKNLHAELKQMGRKHEEQEKRHWMTSVTAYIAFAVIAAAGAIAYARAEVRTAPDEAQTNEPRAIPLHKAATKIKSAHHVPRATPHKPAPAHNLPA